MKKFKLFVLLLSGVSLFIGCGKPTIPEKVELPDVSGGYKIVEKFATPAYAQDVIKKDNLLYMAQGEGGLLIIDVSDPEKPQIVSVTTENVRGYSAKIAMKDSVVYIAAGTFGVTVLNVANPNEPFVTVSNTSMKPAKNLYIMGDYLYTAISEQGVKIAEISYLPQPDPRGVTLTSGYAHSVVVTSDTVFMLVACGEMGLSIFNISDFQNGYGEYPLVSLCVTPGYAEDIVLSDNESIAFMACGTAGLQIIDFSDTTNVHIVGSFDSGGYAKELMYLDQRIYMTAEMSGLQIIDVTDVTTPYLLGSVDTEFALGLDVNEDYIFVADEDEGLIIISIPD